MFCGYSCHKLWQKYRIFMDDIITTLIEIKVETIIRNQSVVLLFFTALTIFLHGIESIWTENYILTTISPEPCNHHYNNMRRLYFVF